MAIRTFNNFGYEGSIVTVEVDLRRGIPAVDIVGLADGVVKETREITRSAIINSSFEYPQERVLISLSPADLKKEGSGFDLPIALAILASKDDYPRSQDAEVFVMGELELSGNVRAVRAVTAGLQTAVASGIKYAIIPYSQNVEIPRGIEVTKVGSLQEAYDALARFDEYEVYHDDSDFTENTEDKEKFEIKFTDNAETKDFDTIKNMNGLKYAMAVAVAGHHNILVSGSYGCGKTMMLRHLPDLMPDLLPEEKSSVRRIYSLAGLESSKTITQRPFREPHPTASLEGMCGGGVHCSCGEVSLAHSGVLFLNEAAEFKSSVLQLLRVPLECNYITLSRAGRSTTYPSNFQLVMATAPCPCGNLGSKDKICLCSAKAVEQYWKKFSSPLLDRVGIRFDCNDEDNKTEYTLDTLREMIKTAWERQYQRQGKLNEDLTVEEVENYIHITDDAQILLDNTTSKYGYSPREITLVKKIARTLADIHDDDDTKPVVRVYVKQAILLHKKTPLETMFN